MRSEIIFWLTLLNAVCWPVCFWLMFRISCRQDALLQQLREQGERIEGLSREEHDLIKDVHPAIGEIQEGVAKVKGAVESSPQGG
jgi:hypothetical protein